MQLFKSISFWSNDIASVVWGLDGMLETWHALTLGTIENWLCCYIWHCSPQEVGAGRLEGEGPFQLCKEFEIPFLKKSIKNLVYMHGY